MSFFTTTNVADEREFYAFHTQPSWIQSVNWRIRAVRKVYGDIPTGMPRVTLRRLERLVHEPSTRLSPSTSTRRTTRHPAEIALAGTVSGDVVSTPASPQAHELLPAFRLTGNYRSWGKPGLLDTTTELFRVYVFTDSECVNRVYTGAIVGGPAYAPRLGQTLAYPGTFAGLNAARSEWLKYGAEGTSVMWDGTPVAAADVGAAPGPTSGTPTGRAAATTGPSCRFSQRPDPVDGSKIMEYRDIQLPEDVCRAGGAARFGKVSKPVLVGDKAPYASGLSPGRQARSGHTHRSRLSTEPRSSPGSPSLGAHEYEVQWSRKLNPWRTEPAPLKTGATSAVLPLTAGRWYYRVRGLNYMLPAKPEMTWSKPSASRSLSRASRSSSARRLSRAASAAAS